MAQDLYYLSGSQSGSLTLVRENGQVNFWSEITSLQISGSAYDATISGSEFGGTVATARIYAYSSSVLIVSFPLESTNLYYNNFPNNFGSEVSGNLVFLDFSSISDDPSITGSYFSIYDLTTTSSYISSYNTTGSGGFSIIAGNNYLFTITESNGNTAYLYFNNTTSGSNILTLSASSNTVSASYIPAAFSDYQVTFSVIVPAP